MENKTKINAGNTVPLAGGAPTTIRKNEAYAKEGQGRNRVAEGKDSYEKNYYRKDAYKTKTGI